MDTEPDTLTDELVETETSELVLAEKLIDILCPALTLVFTFMPHPPYVGVTFIVLVTEFRPLENGIATKVSL